MGKSARGEKKSRKRSRSSSQSKHSTDQVTDLSSSDTDSSSSSSDSDSTKVRKKMEKVIKKIKREEKKTKKRLKKKLKNEKKKLKKVKMNREKEVPSYQSIPTILDLPPVIEKSSNVPIGLMEKSKAMAPMTKDEWEKRQAIVRKVLDEDTGRYRLIKGDGEVLEEIVPQKRHKEINKGATQADGAYFLAHTTKRH